MYDVLRVSKELCSKCNLKNRYSSSKNTAQLYKIKYKNKKTTKLERNRSSILTNNLDLYIISGCGNKKDHLHEVYLGSNRINSMKYGCVIPLGFKYHS